MFASICMRIAIAVDCNCMERVVLYLYLFALFYDRSFNVCLFVLSAFVSTCINFYCSVFFIATDAMGTHTVGVRYAFLPTVIL